MTNLVAGSLAGQAASHSVDMVADLKIGHIMSATPKGQFWAQLAGTVATVIPMTGLFLLYTKAYPCITDHTIEPCQFEQPAVMAWKAVAMAMTESDNPIPKSSGMFPDNETHFRDNGNRTRSHYRSGNSNETKSSTEVSPILSQLGCARRSLHIAGPQLWLSVNLWCTYSIFCEEISACSVGDVWLPFSRRAGRWRGLFWFAGSWLGSWRGWCGGQGNQNRAAMAIAPRNIHAMSQFSSMFILEVQKYLQNQSIQSMQPILVSQMIER